MLTHLTHYYLLLFFEPGGLPGFLRGGSSTSTGSRALPRPLPRPLPRLLPLCSGSGSGSALGSGSATGSGLGSDGMKFSTPGLGGEIGFTKALSTFACRPLTPLETKGTDAYLDGMASIFRCCLIAMMCIQHSIAIVSTCTSDLTVCY